MPVDAIDHVNIRTSDVPGTARFFADVLDMRITASPGNPDPEKAAWVCDAEGRAVVHLARPDILYPWEATPPAPSAPGSGRVHHVALRCSGYETVSARLQDQGYRFETNDIPQVGLRQIFVADPNGILFELNFFAG